MREPGRLDVPLPLRYFPKMTQIAPPPYDDHYATENLFHVCVGLSAALGRLSMPPGDAERDWTPPIDGRELDRAVTELCLIQAGYLAATSRDDARRRVETAGQIAGVLQELAILVESKHPDGSRVIRARAAAIRAAIKDAEVEFGVDAQRPSAEWKEHTRSAPGLVARATALVGAMSRPSSLGAVE